MVWLKRSTNITSQNFDISLLGEIKADSGVKVNAETAMGLTAYRRCVDLISTTAARIRPKILKRIESGGREKAKQHNLWHILRHDANRFVTSYNFFQNWFANAAVYGDGYAIVERDLSGDVVALHNVESNPRSCYPVVEYDGGRLVDLYYVVNSDGRQIPFLADDILHLCHTSTLSNVVDGLDAVQSIRQSLGLSIATIKYSSMYMSNGGHGTKILEIPNWLTPEQRDQLKDSVISLHRGLDSAHKVVPVFGGATIKTLPLDAEQAQLIQSRQTNDTAVAVSFGIPPHKVGAPMNVSFKSLSEENMSVLHDTYDSWWVSAEQELEKKLLFPSERDTYYIEWDRAAYTQADKVAERQSIIAQYQSELLAWEEGRELLGMSTERTGSFIRPANMVDPSISPPAPPAPRVNEDNEVLRNVTEETIQRAKRRLMKSGKVDGIESMFAAYGEHAQELIRSELNTIEEELENVLPEQRQQVVKKWKTKQLTKTLLAQ